MMLNNVEERRETIVKNILHVKTFIVRMGNSQYHRTASCARLTYRSHKDNYARQLFQISCHKTVGIHSGRKEACQPPLNFFSFHFVPSLPCRCGAIYLTQVSLKCLILFYQNVTLPTVSRTGKHLHPNLFCVESFWLLAFMAHLQPNQSIRWSCCDNSRP